MRFLFQCLTACSTSISKLQHYDVTKNTHCDIACNKRLPLTLTVYQALSHFMMHRCFIRGQRNIYRYLSGKWKSISRQLADITWHWFTFLLSNVRCLFKTLSFRCFKHFSMLVFLSSVKTLLVTEPSIIRITIYVRCSWCMRSKVTETSCTSIKLWNDLLGSSFRNSRFKV